VHAALAYGSSYNQSTQPPPPPPWPSPSPQRKIREGYEAAQAKLKRIEKERTRLASLELAGTYDSLLSCPICLEVRACSSPLLLSTGAGGMCAPVRVYDGPASPPVTFCKGGHPLSPRTHYTTTTQEFKTGPALEENDRGTIRRGTDTLGASSGHLHASNRLPTFLNDCLTFLSAFPFTPPPRFTMFMP
jgi:hypothetical protein